MNEPVQAATDVPDGHVEGLHRQDLRRPQRRSDVPPHDAPRIDVSDERDVSEPGPRRHVGHVTHPEPPRCGRCEAPVHEIRRQRRGLVGARAEHPLRLLHAADPGEAHEAFGLVAADLPPLPAQECTHLPSPVDAVVLRMQPGDLRDEQLVSETPGRWQTLFRGTTSARGDEPTNCRAQHTADGLGPRTDPDARR